MDEISVITSGIDVLHGSQVHNPPITVYLALGSNMGDPVAALDQAVSYMRDSSLITVRAISSYLHTAPYGPVQDQPPFVNAVVCATTYHSPFTILRFCQSIEQALGRRRLVRWGPRSIDVDVVLYGIQSITTSALQVPHPDMHNRYFVMEPLAELGAIIPDEVRRRAVMA
jgi:2-amino-4-hydroxy-6-hydroxymethyldihydropteridine diphosphokinase